MCHLDADTWLPLSGLVIIAAVSLIPSSVSGHRFRPALLEIDAQGEGRYRVTWRRSIRQRAGGEAPGAADLRPRFPEHCRRRGDERTRRERASLVRTWTLICDSGGGASGTLQIEELSHRAIDVLVRVSRPDGTSSTTVLHADRPSMSLGRRGSNAHHTRSVPTYFVLGVEHILWGFDHLLFVLGLLLLVGWERKLIATITAFTLAHSLTLAGASLGVVELPTDALETCIAMSILLLAVEVADARRGQHESLSARYPWAISFGFGLLHGFGFAGALAAIGYPEGRLLSALVTFNLGVEVGQLAVVGAAGLLAWGAKQSPLEPSTRERILEVLLYLIGATAAYWTLRRTVDVMSGIVV